jgi:pimeloyl-ACP methyl ester carboxylesterase
MAKCNRVNKSGVERLFFYLVFLSLCSPLLAFGQGRQPEVLINFEQFSASPDPLNPTWFMWPEPPLTIGSAMFAGGNAVALLRNEGFFPVDQSNVLFFPVSVPRLPTLQDSSGDCPGGLPGRRKLIDFSQKVSNFSALLLNHSDSPVTYTVCDDQGGSQKITLVGEASATISLPENNIRLVGFSSLEFTDLDWFFAIDNVKFTPIDPVFLDPVDSGYLNGPQVTTSTGLLASGGRVVQSIAADGVTQAVVRIPANHAGETLNVTVQDENGTACSGQSGVANDGGVFLLGASSGSADCTADVTAVNTTSNGPMAFVVYRSPANFARGAYDYSTSTRAISLKIQSDDDPNYKLTANASVIRPPVILVHGLWGSAADWKNFYLPIPGLTEDSVDYYQPLLQGVTATYPPYSSCPPHCPDIPTSALGFSYTAPLVDGQIREDIALFRRIQNAAAVTADVVAHSMGGDIVRTIALGVGFKDNKTFGHGPINKLITIGTPHLGSPLATDLLQPASWCVRDALALKKKTSLITVTTSGAPPINGAVGDLQGDGFGGGLSAALNDLFRAGPLPFHMALISAVTQGGNNLDDLNCQGCWAYTLKQGCANLVVQDPLAIALTPSGWDTLFFGQANDAVVPKLSQLNGGIAGPNVPTLPGVIHSPGLASLDFLPPTELDPASNVPDQVIYLLNESPDEPHSDFQ